MANRSIFPGPEDGLDSLFNYDVLRFRLMYWPLVIGWMALALLLGNVVHSIFPWWPV